MAPQFPFLSSSSLTLALDVGDSATKFALERSRKEKREVVIAEAREADVFSWSKTLGTILADTAASYGTPRKIIVSFPPSAFRAHLFDYSRPREDSSVPISEREEGAIRKEAGASAVEETFAHCSSALGISSDALKVGGTRLVGMWANGYRVPELKGARAESVSLRMLVTCIPDSYLRELRDALSSVRPDSLHMVHEAQTADRFFSASRANSLYIDVGNKMTQIGVWKKGVLTAWEEVPSGGSAFTGAVAEEFGMQENTARYLKKRYEQGELSEDAAKKMRELLLPLARHWSTLVIERLQRHVQVFPSAVVFAGGASKLPEIPETLGQALNALPLDGELTVSHLLPQEVSGASVPGGEDPAYTPLFLLIHGSE